MMLVPKRRLAIEGLLQRVGDNQQLARALDSLEANRSLICDKVRTTLVRQAQHLPAILLEQSSIDRLRSSYRRLNLFGLASSQLNFAAFQSAFRLLKSSRFKPPALLFLYFHFEHYADYQPFVEESCLHLVSALEQPVTLNNYATLLSSAFLLSKISGADLGRLAKGLDQLFLTNKQRLLQIGLQPLVELTVYARTVGAQCSDALHRKIIVEDEEAYRQNLSCMEDPAEEDNPVETMLWEDFANLFKATEDPLARKQLCRVAQRLQESTSMSPAAALKLLGCLRRDQLQLFRRIEQQFGFLIQDGALRVTAEFKAALKAAGVRTGQELGLRLRLDGL